MNSSNSKNRQCKKFIPRKTPRYLPGSVHKSVLVGDLKTYNEHLLKCFTATPKVDAKPPKYATDKYLNVPDCVQHYKKQWRIINDNKYILQAINRINRMGGMVDTFNPNAYVRYPKWPKKEKELKKINKENKNIYQKLTTVKSLYEKKEHDKSWKHLSQKIIDQSKYPPYNLVKKTKDQELKELPSISKNLDLIDTGKRPICFLEFKIDDGLVIGRLIVELYNDHVPLTVDNFMTFCQNHSKLTFKNCPVHKIYKDKHLITGDVTGKGGSSIYGETFDAENFDLLHTKAGVLSMIASPDKTVNSQFCITFKESPELDDKYVVFGKVIGGAINVFKLSDFGTKHGRPIVPIIISDCGIIERKKPKKPKKLNTKSKRKNKK